LAGVGTPKVIVWDAYVKKVLFLNVAFKNCSVFEKQQIDE
jgi:hypothetical protein